MRVVFAGTPEVAVPALDAIADSSHDLVGVVTRPDAPAGRGRRLTPSPVAQRAEALGVPVRKPEAWRGAAPVQHAIWAGDEVTGATTFRIVKELDAGPTYGVMTERIRATDTAGELLGRLAEGGAGLLVATLDGIEDGSLVAREQQAEGVSFAPKILVEDARVDWTEPAVAVDRRIRACTPGPGAWSTFDGERIKLGPVTVDPDRGLPPGRLEITKNAVYVGTATQAVRLGEVKAFGKKPMAAADWARGVAFAPDARLGD